MRTIPSLLAATLILGLAPAVPAEDPAPAQAAPASAEAAAAERKLTGQYVWAHADQRGDLEARFTPTEAGKWDVAFHFTFKGDPHVYAGTAEGSLGTGELSGKVFNETKKRTFTFEGRFEEGTFNGTHAEVADGKATEMGTLTLKE